MPARRGAGLGQRKIEIEVRADLRRLLVTMPGSWWIEANQLCQRWTSWLDSKTYCYKLARRGDTVQWFRNDGRSGTARIGD